MSQENVEIVRRQVGTADWAVAARNDEAWRAKLADFGDDFAEEFEFEVFAPAGSVSGKGFDEYRRRFLDWMEPWETYTPGIEEIIDLGDRVVVLGRDRGRMK